jgi:hypothetical protein
MTGGCGLGKPFPGKGAILTSHGETISPARCSLQEI